MKTRASIVLIGFMGTGKTTVGKLLARRLDLALVDTDRLVMEQAGCAIAEIFATRGEAAFREEEHRALASLRGKGGLVVATGGGVVTRPDNLAVLRGLGMVVWLKAGEEVIWDRVSRNDKRPLLKTADPRATIRELLAQRTPLYEEAAEVTVDTSLLSHQEVVDVIEERIRQG